MTANLATDTLDSVVLAKDNVVGSAAANTERTAAQQKDLDAYLASYIKRIEETLATDASHTQAIIAHYYCINPEVSADVHGFFYSKVGKSGFAEQEPLNASELDPNDLEHATWYYTPIERGRPSWVGPYLSHLLNDTWTCSYLVPIYKAGALIGVLGMDIPVETLIDQVSSIQVYDTGFACLLDSDGNVIYHPEYKYGSEFSVPVGEGVLEEEESGDALIRYTVNGQERQVSFTTLSNGMKLLVVAPTAEVNAATTQLVQTVIGVSALIIILFTIICRPRVTAFDEEMYVRHVIGVTSIVRYDDIVRIRRVPMPFMPEFDSLIIELRDGRSVTMSGLLDIDRILLRIDRFDVLED
jgi:hypothetical protein